MTTQPSTDTPASQAVNEIILAYRLNEDRYLLVAGKRMPVAEGATEWRYSELQSINGAEIALMIPELQQKLHYRRMHPARLKALRLEAGVACPQLFYRPKVLSADSVMQGAALFHDSYIQQMLTLETDPSHDAQPE